ncbi:hypothetical protein [Acetobacter malorum]|uniref:Uncharacterized protein n=2 Tax=Acetobacter TaxID=434 RepID=A0A1U9LIZ2_9PROT|nr:hypothetical protein [Acetobacter malorum]AQT06425.1 hypothetical protein A0U91_15540 [Acetobacter persici]KXV09862.1 hypothetical protein AD930_02215 [Acetobacter malorum]
MSETDTSQDGEFHLDIASLGAWMSSRPSLLRAFLASGQPMDSARCHDLVDKIKPDRADIAGIISNLCQDLNGVVGLGRPGRFRIMAWMADVERDEIHPLLPVLIGDIGMEDVPVSPEVSKLFHDDLLQFATNVIAPQSEMTLSTPSIVAALEAGLNTLTPEATPVSEPVAGPSPEGIS